MDITCPYCKQTLEGDETFVGQSVACPACNREFIVTKPATATPVAVAQAVPATKKRKSKAGAIAILVVVALLGLRTFVWLRDSAGQHPEDMFNPEIDEIEALMFDNATAGWSDADRVEFLAHTWTEERRHRYREHPVEWAVFKSRNEERECRLRYMSLQLVRDSNRFQHIKSQLRAIRGEGY